MAGRSSGSGHPLAPSSQLAPVTIVVRVQLPIQRRDRAGIAPASLRRPPLCKCGREITTGYPAAVQARRLRPWFPAIAWAALIFGLSSIPSLGTGLGFWDVLLRKLAHAAEFGWLALLVWFALRRERSAPLRVTGYVAAGLIASGYAATDEYHQSFVSGRVGSATDWAIDTAGVVIALTGLHLWRQRRVRGGRGQSELRRSELPENAP